MNTQVLGDLLDATERDADIAAARGVTPAQSPVFHHFNLATEDYFDALRDQMEAARLSEQPVTIPTIPLYQQVRKTLRTYRSALARLDIIKAAGPRLRTERELCDANAGEEDAEQRFHRALHAWFEDGCKKNSPRALATAHLLFEHYWQLLEKYKAVVAADQAEHHGHGPGPFDPPRDDDTTNYSRHRAAMAADFALWIWRKALYMIRHPRRRTTYEILTDTFDE